MTGERSAGGVLRSYYWYQATASPVFFWPIFFVFYQERAGLTVPVILWLQSYSVGMRAVLDFPFGALADRYSRRGCLAASSLAFVVGSGLLLLWPTLVAAVVAETCFAAAAALKSGADSALLYDALAGEGARELYARAESRGQAITAFGSGAAAVLGGVMAGIDIRLPYLITAITALLSAPLAWRLGRASRHVSTRDSTWSLMRAARVEAAARAEVRWVMALAAFSVVASHIYFYLQQPYLRTVGVPVAFFGVFFAATKLVAAVVADRAHRVDIGYGPRGATLLMAAAPTVGFAAMSVATRPLDGLWLLSRGVLDGLWQPLLNVYLNRLVDSRLRATMLSLQSLVARLALALTISLLGFGTGRFGLQVMLGAVAALTAIIGAVLFVAGRRFTGALAEV